MYNFKVGDIVQIKDWGAMCSTYNDWFIKNAHLLDIDWIARYAYGDNRNFQKYNKMTVEKDDKRKYKILYLDMSEDNYTPAYSHYALIEPFDESSPYKQVFLMSIYGIKPLKKQMTLEEVEEALGYEIEIID